MTLVWRPILSLKQCFSSYHRLRLLKNLLCLPHLHRARPPCSFPRVVLAPMRMLYICQLEHKVAGSQSLRVSLARDLYFSKERGFGWKELWVKCLFLHFSRAIQTLVSFTNAIKVMVQFSLTFHDTSTGFPAK